MVETDKHVEIEIVRFAEGTGYGEGGISGVERREAAGPEVIRAVEAVITNPDEILVDVGVDSDGNMLDDDGCGDGRGIAKIFHKGKELLNSMNRHRAKVFGGGVAMASSVLIGNGLARFKGETNLKSIFGAGISLLQDKGIGFGAHTDTHAAEKAEADHIHNPNCGCGALDKASTVVRNAVKYREEIKGTITALGVDTGGLDEVLDEYAAFAGDMDDSDYTGTGVKEDVQAQGKVTKRLAGDHLEGYALFSLIKGKTVNQNKVREISDDAVQVFAVDVWRMVDIAERIFPGQDEESLHSRNKAFMSQLVYTLAVSATLTKGDLPIYILREQEQAAA